MLFCKDWFDCFLRTIINYKKFQKNTHKPIASPRAEEQMHSKNPKVWQIQKEFRDFSKFDCKHQIQGYIYHTANN